MQQQREETGGNIIKDIFFLIKKHLVLILVLLILGGSCGLGYSFVKKPNYVASVSVAYRAGLLSSNDTVSSGGVAEINIMRAFINTVIDFCDEGVVVDRANFYYVQYKNLVYDYEQQNKEYSFFDFIDYILSEDPYQGGSNLAEEDKYYIVKEKISTSVSVVEAKEDEFFFAIRYTDEEQSESRIKCRLVIESIKKELEKKDSGKTQYFDVVFNEIIPLYEGEWWPSVSSDISKKKFTIIGAVIGVLIAAAIIYIVNALDNSVNNRETLEELTGVSVLSVIEDK